MPLALTSEQTKRENCPNHRYQRPLPGGRGGRLRVPFPRPLLPPGQTHRDPSPPGSVPPGAERASLNSRDTSKDTATAATGPSAQASAALGTWAGGCGCQDGGSGDAEHVSPPRPSSGDVTVHGITQRGHVPRASSRARGTLRGTCEITGERQQLQYLCTPQTRVSRSDAAEEQPGTRDCEGRPRPASA